MELLESSAATKILVPEVGCEVEVGRESGHGVLWVGIDAEMELGAWIEVAGCAVNAELEMERI